MVRGSWRGPLYRVGGAVRDMRAQLRTAGAQAGRQAGARRAPGLRRPRLSAHPPRPRGAQDGAAGRGLDRPVRVRVGPDEPHQVGPPGRRRHRPRPAHHPDDPRAGLPLRRRRHRAARLPGGHRRTPDGGTARRHGRIGLGGRRLGSAGGRPRRGAADRGRVPGRPHRPAPPAGRRRAPAGPGRGHVGPVDHRHRPVRVRGRRARRDDAAAAVPARRGARAVPDRAGERVRGARPEHPPALAGGGAASCSWWRPSGPGSCWRSITSSTRRPRRWPSSTTSPA